MHLSLTRWLVGAVLSACVGIVSVAHAQPYPSKPIRLVVPYGPGGPSDVLARVLADEMAKTLGQPIVVDNRPGAGSMLGTELVVRSLADGYTLLLTDLPVTIVPHVMKSIAKYDPARDLEPISLIGTSTLGFYVPGDSPARTIAEFVAASRSRPEGAQIGSGGNGTLTHLMAEVFAHAASLRMTHIPYQGLGPAMPDLLSGRLDGMFNSYLTTQPFIAGGKLRPLAVASRSRAAELAAVPTFAEAGWPAVSVEYWLGIAGPVGLPRPVSDAVRAALAKALSAPIVKERFQSLALTASGDLSAAALRSAIQVDQKRWGDVVRDRQISTN
jgi:tripartite-type tricarboxylate transporter receptor subunit TctC